MRDLRGVFVLALLAGGLPPTAWAAPYWVAYEGAVLPEEVGWRRRVIDDTGHEPPGAVRSISDGVLTIDSSRSSDFSDFYQINRAINPEAGETFVAQWRVKVSELINPFGFSDVGVAIAPDQGGALGLSFFRNRVRSTTESWVIPLEPNAFHSFEIQSIDMESYDLWIDGQFARSGHWDLNSLNRSFVTFGDGAQGLDITSVSQWDYFRFGVVPEPASAVIAAFGLLATPLLRRLV